MKYVDEQGRFAPQTIELDGMLVLNPTAEQYERAGYTKFVEPMQTEDELLKQAIAAKIEEIREYDKSTEVNSFSLDGFNAWINREDRIGTRKAIELVKSGGKQECEIWLQGVQLKVNCDLALRLLDEVGRYAYDAYNCTQSHIHAVGLLKTIEEVNNYDYKKGYPKKLELKTTL